jgi:hypothetical protein
MQSSSRNRVNRFSSSSCRRVSNRRIEYARYISKGSDVSSAVNSQRSIFIELRKVFQYHIRRFSLACREGIIVDLPPGFVTAQFFGVHALNGNHGVRQE